MSLNFLNDKQHFSKNQPPAKKRFWRHIYLKRCMAKMYSITYNPARVESKPKKYSNEMNRHLAGINVPTGVTIQGFAEMVSAPNSHSWYGGTYSNTISNQNWTSKGQKPTTQSQIRCCLSSQRSRTTAISSTSGS